MVHTTELKNYGWVLTVMLNPGQEWNYHLTDSETGFFLVSVGHLCDLPDLFQKLMSCESQNFKQLLWHHFLTDFHIQYTI